jgi:hypothetical protein
MQGAERAGGRPVGVSQAEQGLAPLAGERLFGMLIVHARAFFVIRVQKGAKGRGRSCATTDVLTASWDFFLLFFFFCTVVHM